MSDRVVIVSGSEQTRGTSPPVFSHGGLASQVASWLRQQLREQRWTVGDQLPSEALLASELDVGRSSIREAVRLLSSEGLVEVRHGTGTFVTAPEPASQDTAALLRQARLAGVYEVRRALEVEAARLAAARAQPEDVAGLRDRLGERATRASAEHESAGFVAADLEFHETVVALSGNAVLLHLFQVARPVMYEALTSRIAADGHLPDTDTEHERLLTALEHGDIAGAMRAAEANLATVLTDSPPH